MFPPHLHDPTANTSLIILPRRDTPDDMGLSHRENSKAEAMANIVFSQLVFHKKCERSTTRQLWNLPRFGLEFVEFLVAKDVSAGVTK